MKSKNLIEKQLQKKTNKDLVETIIAVKKNDSWRKILGEISGPSRKRVSINLEKINEFAKEGDIIIIPGKVLSMGEITKKIKIAALGFSGTAKEKILNSKNEAILISQEIKKNPSAKGVKILK
jgi:large subunit ribosomal protein L18e